MPEKSYEYQKIVSIVLYALFLTQYHHLMNKNETSIIDTELTIIEYIYY